MKPSLYLRHPWTPAPSRCASRRGPSSPRRCRCRPGDLRLCRCSRLHDRSIRERFSENNISCHFWTRREVRTAGRTKQPCASVLRASCFNAQCSGLMVGVSQHLILCIQRREVYYYPTTVLCLGRQTRSHREAMLPSEFLKPISSYYLPPP